MRSPSRRTSIVPREGYVKEQKPLLDYLRDKDEADINIGHSSGSFLPSPPSKDWLGLVIVMLVLLLSESARGIVIPTFASYVASLGGEETMLGIAVAGFSAGRFISTIVLGYLSTRRAYKEVFLGSIIFVVVGNVMYGFGELGGVYLLLVSRVLCGIGAGTLSVVRAYIVQITTKAERTFYMSIVGAVQFLGFAITPGIGSSLAYLHPFSIGKLLLDKHTIPGFLLAILNAVVFAVIIHSFSEPAKESDSLNQLDSVSIQQSPKDTRKSPGTQRVADQAKWRARRIFAVFLVLNLLVRMVLSIIETLVTILYLELWVDDTGKNREIGFILSGLGVLGMFILLGIGWLSKKIPDFYILMVGNLSLILGCGLLIGTNISLARFLIGCGLIWCIGFPLAQTTVVSMFSKAIGNVPQGSYMGFIGAAGSLGRIIGPIVSGAIYDNHGQPVTFIFGTSIAVISLLLSLTLPRKS